MPEIWLLLFLFKGSLYASGPHDLETCLEMARVEPLRVCVQMDRPTQRRLPPA